MALLHFAHGSPTELRAAYDCLAAEKNDDAYKTAARAMIEILGPLEQLCEEAPVWGMLSHDVLVLLSDANFESRRQVMITADVMHGYLIRYKMAPAEAPWADATVHGHADSVEAAIRMVATAMDRTEGWPAYRFVDRLRTSIDKT